MGESEDFILVEDEDDFSEPKKPLPEAMPETQKAALSERFSRLTKGISVQVDAVKDRLKPRMDVVEEQGGTSPSDVKDMSLEIDGVHIFEWPIKGMDCPD